jgi:hypothetical protein
VTLHDRYVPGRSLGTTMSFAAGFILLGIAAVMMLVARPRDGVAAPFFKVGIVGQLYSVASLICIVMGVTLVVINWP